MKTLLLRLLPFLLAAGALLAAFAQWAAPPSYPFPIALWFLAYAAACLALAWRRLGWREAFEKILPSALALLAAGFAFLIAESSLERSLLAVALAGIALLVLELLFLLTRDSEKYPVNALSRVNLALIPVTAFFLVATLNALYVFLLWWPWWGVLLGATAFGALAYALTAHPTADARHRGRWGALGALAGAHAGLLAVLLPVGIVVQGALASLLLAIPLRIRRYAYHPIPSRRHAWVEGLLSLMAFIALLATSRWA